MVKRRRKGGAVTRSQTRRAAVASVPTRHRKAPSAAAAALIRKGYSLRDASRIIAAAVFGASKKAQEKNPRLARTKGFYKKDRYSFH